jgi:hypothetical protein
LVAEHHHERSQARWNAHGQDARLRSVAGQVAGSWLFCIGDSAGNDVYKL